MKTVYNGGNGTSKASKVYILDKNNKKLGQVSVSALAAKKSKTYSFVIGAGKLSSGSNKITVKADGSKVMKESNETNNVASKVLKVAQASAPASVPCPDSAGSNWEVIAFEDFNNDGFRDLLLKNDTDLAD